MSQLQLIFTDHAKERWQERFGKLDMQDELKRLRRVKRFERKKMQLGHRKHKVYRTKSGAHLVVSNNIVVTVLY